MKNQPVIIDGARTPFLRSGKKFARFMAHELGRLAINGLVEKSKWDVDDIDYVCMGTVISDPNTSNLAREITLESILSKHTPAHTVVMACISSNIAATSIANMISVGQIELGIAGGVETFSDIPIRLSKDLRKALLRLKDAKGMVAKLKILSKIRPTHLKPDIPSPKEFSTGFTMGDAGDQLAARFLISRMDADSYALISHQRAAKAWQSGFYDEQVIPVRPPPHYELVKQDDGPRPNSTPEALSKLKTSFNTLGINTAANSSPFTDGASAALIASQKYCSDRNIKPLAKIVDYLYQAGDPLHELLLGPALTVPYLLKRNGLSVTDIDVWEIHEAFAGQVLANLKAMASDRFCRERLGLNEAIGDISLDKTNLWGGSLSLGHPFGATGARLLITAAERLKKEDARLAVVTGCAASGLGSAILLQRD